MKKKLTGVSVRQTLHLSITRGSQQPQTKFTTEFQSLVKCHLFENFEFFLLENLKFGIYFSRDVCKHILLIARTCYVASEHSVGYVSVI
jgi:hypothetical protein